MAANVGQLADFVKQSGESSREGRCYHAASAEAFSVEGLQPISWLGGGSALADLGGGGAGRR